MATIDDFEWHDAVISNILINRMDPGNEDVIKLEVTWPDDKNGSVIFQEVYSARMALNMGIVALETIDTLFQDNSDPDLSAFYKVWKGLFDDVEINCYVLKTNSTGSEIKILAKSIEIVSI